MENRQWCLALKAVEDKELLPQLECKSSDSNRSEGKEDFQMHANAMKREVLGEGDGSREGKERRMGNGVIKFTFWLSEMLMNKK
jgi:hypothetical protein